MNVSELGKNVNTTTTYREKNKLNQLEKRQTLVNFIASAGKNLRNIFFISIKSTLVANNFKWLHDGYILV